jgi:formyltetrahydrofolate deformylase
MSDPQFRLTLNCPNRQGIVASVSAAILAAQGNIEAAHQFDDKETGRFFSCIVASFPTLEDGAGLAARIGPIAERFRMDWMFRPKGYRSKVLLLVSKFDHCLVDLLYRWRTGEFAMDVVGVVSNHPRETYNAIDLLGLPFHYLPTSKDTKPAQEAQIKAIVQETGAELVVLARYMQILSDDLSAFLAGRCINIHHSFLPGFKGARPYHQAHARGVKLIGATAHYVTPDLDEGPIIEQDSERISHSDSPEDLVRKGRDVERRVLARAVGLHLEGRVMISGQKTIVFRD